MTNKTALPEEFSGVVDAAVAHVLDGCPLECSLEPLQSWIESNDLDGLCLNMEVCVHGDYLKQFFIDCDARDWMCLDDEEPLTDEHRLAFAKYFVSGMLEEGPSLAIHAYWLLDSAGRSAVLGVMSDGPGGQHGFAWQWLGVFPDWGGVRRLAAERGLWVGEELYELDETKVLQLWKGHSDRHHR